jgi:hypothetical protein
MRGMRIFAICIAFGLGLVCLGKCALWFVGVTPVAQAMGWAGLPPSLWFRLVPWVFGAIVSFAAAVMLASLGPRDPA